VELELALEASLDRAVDVLDHQNAGLMCVFGRYESEYRLEFVQNPIAAGVIDGLGEKLSFLNGECVVFIVRKESDLWVWSGTRDGQRKTLKYPFKLVDGDMVVGDPIAIGTLNSLPIDLFWRRQ